ncbi:hypothetical protein [Pelagibacterium limicola]|uniref:hypothetical protein n=1 Tax=Pelagibacterium limicola TaxID=2791022 RepID=UPI0018AF5511|nr:hypothetical protein [Pelagibacterium limicola]
MATGARKFTNLVLLLGGFATGQGAIFLAQTWLVARQDLALLSAFGIHFSFVILAALVIDWGGVTVLARETAQHASQPRSATEIWGAYWSMAAFRLLVGLVVGAAALVTFAISSDVFTKAYLLAALPLILIWPFNLTGLLDGWRMSGISGISAIPPYILAALSIVLASGSEPETAGLIMGAALSVGFALVVAIQFTFVQVTGRGPKWARPNWTNIWRAGQSGFGALWSTLPGQLYFRVQLIFAAAFLGEVAVAILIYAKQLVSGFSQLIAFMRRVEFPDLVARLGAATGHPISEILRVQQKGTLAAAISMILLCTVGIVSGLVLKDAPASAGVAVAIFGPTVLSGAIALSFIQGLNALGLYSSAAIIMLFSVALGTALSSVTVAISSLAVLAFADVVANVLTVALACGLLHRRARSREQASV